jgi:hypothetical protein
LETGQRGFVITGDPSYLQPYADGVAQVEQTLTTLDDMLRDNPAQLASLSLLRVDTAQKLQELAQSIQLRRTDGFDAHDLVAADGYCVWWLDANDHRWHIVASDGISDTFANQIVASFQQDGVSTVPRRSWNWRKLCLSGIRRIRIRPTVCIT